MNASVPPGPLTPALQTQAATSDLRGCWGPHACTAGPLLTVISPVSRYPTSVCLHILYQPRTAQLTIQVRSITYPQLTKLPSMCHPLIPIRNPLTQQIVVSEEDIHSRDTQAKCSQGSEPFLTHRHTHPLSHCMQPYTLPSS